MNLAKALLLFCFTGSIVATAAAAEPAATDIPKIKYDKYTLPNGLDVILVEDHRLPVVAVNVWYHVGAANEEPGLTGFAHLFEHMMFGATRHLPRGAADALLEAAGAETSNGSTSFDRTNYFETVPAHQLELALWIESDKMGYLLDRLDQTTLSNQQDVVRNERRQQHENEPYGVVEEGFFHTLFAKEHPYHAMIIGSHADIQAAKLDDIKKFFKTYYRPNNASLVIVGDIDKANAGKLVQKYFGSLKRGPQLRALRVATAPITSEQRAVIHDRIELPKVIMGWHTSPIYQPGDAELTLAAQVLGGGKSSRLYQKLVYEKQIAQDVTAYQYSLGVSSIFGIEVTARPGHTAEELEAAIDQELDGLRAGPPDEMEMARARNGIETQLVAQMERSGGLADLINQYNHYTGDPGFVTKEFAMYQQVDGSAIQKAVAEQLKNSARVVVWGLPGEQDLGPEVPTPPAAQSVAGAGAESLNADQPWRARPPKPGKLRPLTVPQGQAFQLANGLTVIHSYKPGLPLAAAELVVHSGSDANPLDKPGLAGFTMDLLDEGTNTRNSLQITNAVAQLGANLTAGASVDASIVSVSALTRNFPGAFDIFADIALNPAFPAEEVERQRASRLGDMVQSREEPSAILSTLTSAVMYGHEHPYGFTQLGTESAIKATTRDDLVDFWRQHFVPNNAALVIVGNISSTEARTLAEAKFGAWKAVPLQQATQGSVMRSAARVVLVNKPGSPQTALRVATDAPDRRNPAIPALQVMNAGLGGLFTSRLNNNLREEKGYTYGVRSQFIFHRQPGIYMIQANVRTDVTGPAVSEMLKELRGVLSNPYSAEELAKARDSQLLSLPAQFETGSAIMSSLANTYIFDLGLDYYNKLPSRLRAVNGAQVRSAAEEYIKPDNFVVLGVGDAAKIVPQLEKLNLGPIEYRDTDGNVIAPAPAAASR